MPSKDSALRPRLQQAAARLHEVGSPELAQAVEEILAPTGWGKLRRSDPNASGSGASLGRNLAMGMPADWRDQLKAALEQKGLKVADLVNEGLAKYLAGEFVPVDKPRSPRGSGVKQVMYNCRPDDDKRRQVDEMDGPAAEWVAGAYLLSRFKVGPYAPKKSSKKAE